jgi:multicomponent Na+:H+ antiporter subunit F
VACEVALAVAEGAQSRQGVTAMLVRDRKPRSRLGVLAKGFNRGNARARSFRQEGRMHEIVFYAAALWMAVLLCVSLLTVVRARSSLTRVLALDMVTLLLIALLILYSDSRRVGYYLDAALVLSMLSFLATIAAARYHSEGEIF